MRAVDRRTFLGGTLATIASIQMPGGAMLAQGAEKAHSAAIPTADQRNWQDLEVGMFIHFAPNTWQDRQNDDLSTPLESIDPDVDTDNWAECAVNLGARYIVFVAKHVGGFCMWNTNTTPYSIGHTKWKNGHGDVLSDLSASCNRHGLRLGVYLSPKDKYFGAEVGGVCKDPSRQETYNAMYRTQLTEVLTRYGQLVELWFDGSIVVPVADIVHKYAPHAAIYQGPEATIRWVGNEKGFAPLPLWNTVSRETAQSGVSTAKNADPNGDTWLPVESDVSIRRPDWFWSTTNEHKLMTKEQLLEVYYRSVGRGSQLLLNMPPDRRGHIPDADFALVREFGADIKQRFGRSEAEGSGKGPHLVLHLSSSKNIDHVILEEDCRFGQRVSAFQVEGRLNSEWAALNTGSTIGHKRIIPITPQTYSALRLTIIETNGQPRIRRFAAFSTGVTPPSGWDAA